MPSMKPTPEPHPHDTIRPLPADALAVIDTVFVNAVAYADLPNYARWQVDRSLGRDRATECRFLMTSAGFVFAHRRVL